MPTPVKSKPAPLSPFKNAELRDAVEWGLLLLDGSDMTHVQYLLNTQLASRLLTFAVERVFMAGVSPTHGRASLLRLALLHLYNTGDMPTAEHVFKH